MDTLTLPTALLLWAAGYLIACTLFPFAACRNCQGSGKFRSPSGRAWRNCRRCKGTGRRIRLGRRIWAKARRVL
ncbi:hypothetical protein [Kineosporia sp. A_224]|uniref:hypothetical protein n=1 Tax=Kineosporia sp. A_224 TaxID=1962180 RepID=UPI000B4ACB46|nr:hypothetical protein [Kineosporia sp. A_224]